MNTPRHIRGILIVGILFSLASTVFGSGGGKGIVSTEDGFVDIDFPIVDSKKTATGLVSVIARGEVQGNAVGFAVDINPSWKPKPTTDKRIIFYWGSAQFRSIGKESDTFVRVLAGMYRRPCPAAYMPLRIYVEAVGLAEELIENDTLPKMWS